MPLKVRNLPDIRSFRLDNQNFGKKIYEALTDIINGHNLIEQQTNSASHAQRPAPPPQINGVTVMGQNGHFNVAINDSNPNIYSGIKYYAEHDDNPGFTNPQIIDLGSSRNHSIFLGGVARYWRAYSAYPSSQASAPVYHGGGAYPQVVYGGGTVGGPMFQTSQGSGTGLPGQGVSGPGPLAYRTINGKPPTREA